MNIQGIPEISGLKKRFAALFAVLSAAVIGGAFAYAINYRAGLRTEAEKLLLSIGKATTEHLTHWTGERVRTAESLLDTPFFSVYLNRLAADRGDKEAAGLCRQRLEAYLRHNPYDTAMIVGPDGQVLVSAGLKLKSICPVARALIPRANSSGKVEMGEFYLTPGDAGPHIDFVSRAARGPGGKNLFLVLRSRPKVYLYPLLDAWPIPTSTGETLLVRRDGDKVTYLSRLRQGGAAPLTKQLPLDTPGLAAALALKGGAGIIRGVDYSGADVLAAAALLPGTNWAVVTKINWDEAMRDADALSVLLALFTLIFVGASGAAFFLLFRLQAGAYSRAAAAAESRLSRSEDRFRIFFENSPLGESITELDGRVRVNRVFCGMLGYTEEELRGKKWQDLTPPEDVPMTEQMVRALVDGKRDSVQFEKRFFRKNGGILLAEVNSSVQRDAAGRPEYLLTTLNDITSRKLTEERLRQNSLLMERTQRLAGIGGWEWNVAEKTMHWTGEMYRIHDLDPADIKPGPEAHIARSQQCYRPEDLSAVMSAFNRCAEFGEPYDLEFPFTTLKGRKLWVRTTAQAERAGERVVKVIGTLADITGRKRNEVLNAAHAHLVHFSLSHSLDELLEETINEAEKLTGSLIGFYHFIDPDQQNLTLQNWSTRTKAEFCRAEGKGKHYPISRAGVWVDCVRERKPVIHNDYASLPHRKGLPKGHAPVIRELAAPVLRDGKITAILGVGNKPSGYDQADVETVALLADLAWEIAERKRAEEAVDRLNREMVVKNNEMENFLYIATHDLRSPLVNIQGFSQNLQGYARELGELAARAALPDRERARLQELSGGEIPEALGFVLESSRRMDALITALLKVSRAGRLELKPEKVDMHGLIKSILDSMHYQLLGSGAEVKLGELPPCLADPGAVSQLFSNLLDNAVKYRDPARPLVVEISGKAEGPRSFYTVSDNGQAIKETDLPRLWDLFYKPAGRNQGEGIGLPMVKKLAERSGGGIRAELRTGGGMLFRVELPRGGGL